MEGSIPPLDGWPIVRAPLRGPQAHVEPRVPVILLDDTLSEGVAQDVLGEIATVLAGGSSPYARRPRPRLRLVHGQGAR